MPATRHTAAVAVKPDPRPPDPPASSARAAPKLRRSPRTVSTRAAPLTSSLAATDSQTEQVPERGQEIDQDVVEEPARKRKRRKEPVEAVTAAVPAPEVSADVRASANEAPAAPTRMTRTAASIRRVPRRAGRCRRHHTVGLVAGVEGNDNDGADFSIYGSKIKALVQIVRRVVREDPTAKLILFSQFHRLTALMAHALSEFGIAHVKLMDGTVITKRRAITLFRTDPNTKTLFLSVPTSSKEREVTVTRFVARGTIEEEITARRCDTRAAAEADLAQMEGAETGGDMM
ncbi:hypothetical protein GGF32_004320 [Allomyces javanicus]|nr:hypothetical protein GGF32_004320 [Allomyces javanicus]